MSDVRSPKHYTTKHLSLDAERIVSESPPACLVLKAVLCFQISGINHAGHQTRHCRVNKTVYIYRLHAVLLLRYSKNCSLVFCVI